jgi:glyoxylase-like metal-dependent hydrolase (beta-lactamase superfamily II)
MDSIYEFKLGNFDCAVVADGSRPDTITKTYPTVPAADVSAAMRTLGYDSDEITVGFNLLTINTGEKRVLVDTGFGRGVLLANLAKLDISLDDIDIIIITHGDGDHIGGLSQFPNAQFVLWQGAWDLWTDDDVRTPMLQQLTTIFTGMTEEMLERRADYGRFTLPNLQSENRLQLVQLEEEFLLGFQLIAAPGHRADHVAVQIQSHGEPLLHIVDSIRHPVQIANPTWVSYIDSYAEQIVDTNKQLLNRAVETEAILFTAHMQFPALGRVMKTDDGFRWETY